MIKTGLSKTKTTIVTNACLGLIVLGLGFVCFALINIVSSRAVESVKVLDIEQPIETHVSDKNLYPVYPSEGDVIGTLSIPALDMELPIIQGTGENDLEKGVGHFLQSVLPGEDDNCVLSGHRDTIFAELGELKIGDQLTVTTSAGTFTYEMSGTRIVDKDDKTVIVPTDHGVLTLTTCYPFSYVGFAPDRYIVSADLVTDEYPQCLQRIYLSDFIKTH